MSWSLFPGTVNSVLDDRYDDQIPPEHRFNPDMLFSSIKAHKVKIGLVIDLTNTERFYDKAIIERNECKYIIISSWPARVTGRRHRLRMFSCLSTSANNSYKKILWRSLESTAPTGLTGRH